MIDLGLDVTHIELETQHLTRKNLWGAGNFQRSSEKCRTRAEAGQKMLDHVHASETWKGVKDDPETPHKLMKRFETLIRLNIDRNEKQPHVLLWIVGLVHAKRLQLIYRHVAEHLRHPTKLDLDVLPSKEMIGIRHEVEAPPSPDDDLGINIEEQADDQITLDTNIAEEQRSSDNTNNAGNG
jgi:hypothetical protein